MFERKSFMAEVLGTFILTFIGCGSVLAANVMLETTNGAFGYVEIVGIALAFGIALMAAAYTVGPISGGHFNPAVSIGLALAGRFEWDRVPVYIIAQSIGASIASLLLWFAAGTLQFGLGQTTIGVFGASGAFVMEAILTFLLVFIILGTTSEKAAAGFAGIPIGLYLGAAQIVGIPYSGASLNPARSLGPALFVQGAALNQFWLYVLAPIIGGALAAIIYKVTVADSPAAHPLPATKPTGD